MDMLMWVLIAFVFTYYTWGMYLAAMTLIRAKETLSMTSKVFAYPFVFYGVVVDFLFNAVIGSAIFLEPPKEWLFTARVSRWNDDDGWRGATARWICMHLLDPFDPDGTHCS